MVATVNSNERPTIHNRSSGSSSSPFSFLPGLVAGLHCVKNFLPLIPRFAKSWLEHPEPLLQEAQAWFNSHQQLISQSIKQISGEPCEPVVTPERSDRRFKHKYWKDKWFFNLIKQSYLLSEQSAYQLIENSVAINQDTKIQTQRLVEEIFNCLSPSNCVLTNPEVFELTKKTKGENLRRGWEHFKEDSDYWRGYFNLIKTDFNHYQVGKNLATSNGKVIYQNEIMQLLHYAPLNPAGYEKPLLMTPSFINKFYIFDLNAQNSFVHWLLEQGFDVYLISWANPNKTHANYGVEYYVEQGPLKALSLLINEYGYYSVNLLGYCLGGVFNALAAQYCSVKGNRHWVQSLSFLASRFDFSMPNRLSQLFCMKEGLDLLDFLCAGMRTPGVWDGRKIAAFFNLLHSREYYWSYYVSRYLRGSNGTPNPMLYWLQDVVHITERLAKFYMIDMIRENIFFSDRFLSIHGTAIKITDLNFPTFALGLKDDQLSLWKDVFASSKLFLPNCHFILAGGDHISGVVNPPKRQKYGYWVNAAGFDIDTHPEEWFANATFQAGSWWPVYAAWLKNNSGNLVSAISGYENQSALEPAPGTYVLTRI